MDKMKSFRITDKVDKRLLEYVHTRKATGEKCRFSDILNDAIQLYLDSVSAKASSDKSDKSASNN